MMSLVAYGSSGESENESDTETESVHGKSVTLPVRNEAITASKSFSPAKDVKTSLHKNSTSKHSSGTQADLHLKLPPPKNILESVEDVNSEESLELSSKLPAPKHHTTSSLLGTSIVLPQPTKTKNMKGTVKIMIPSLSDFPEDEDEPKAKKKFQPSAKGSGLFALLPPPKQAIAKEASRSLVPNVLTRKPVSVPPVKRPIPKQFLKPVVERKQPDTDPESDGEADGIDFFSLNKEHKLPDIPVAEVSLGYQNLMTHETPSTSQHGIDCDQPQYEPYSQQAEGVVPQADSGQDFISFSGGTDLELDDEALLKLCGRKRRNREEIQIVDVSGDAIMPDQREWLTKQLTQEQPRPSSKSKLNGPSSQQKRKHQITYLAHIAKENEMELKNQWANNRQTRKQTQSKYGF